MREIPVAIVIIALLASTARAGVTISLPLDGYYRPGRYFPIAIESSTDQPITLHADGAVPTLFDHGQKARSITAMLTTGADVGTLSASSGAVKQTLRPLQSHEALIGIVGGTSQQAAARQLIPGTRPLFVPLDPTHPLSGPPLAWQSLDAVVLDQWPARLQLDDLPTLLAGGMTVAVTSTSQPDQTLPWRPFNGGWALRPNVAGPLGCDGNDDAYVPSGMWHPDLSSVDRYRILAVGILVMAALSIALLLPRRWSVSSVAVVVLGLSVVPISPKRNFQATGDVRVRRVGWEQADRWTYFAGPTRSTINASIKSAAWPIFYEPSQAEQLHCVLIDRGEFSLQFQLPADHRLAIVERMIRPALQSTTQPTALDTVSPMARLAGSLYRDAGAPHVAVDGGGVAGGAMDAPHPSWASVVCGQ